MIDEPRDQVGIQNGAFDQFDVRSISHGGQVVTTTCRKIVEDGDMLAALGQALDEVRADKARPAGDEHARH